MIPSDIVPIFLNNHCCKIPIIIYTNGCMLNINFTKLIGMVLCQRQKDWDVNVKRCSKSNFNLILYLFFNFPENVRVRQEDFGQFFKRRIERYFNARIQVFFNTSSQTKVTENLQKFQSLSLRMTNISMRVNMI